MNNNMRVISIAAIGGILEYYDFVIFVLFAKMLSVNFFSSTHSPFFTLLATYTIFAVGYFVRPIGGTILAHFGDKYGRKIIFLLTVFLMAVPTFLIGVLPGYASIGSLSTILLLLFRICQGLAVGGEIPGSATFVYEHMHENSKYTGIATLFSGLVGGILLGSIVGATISGILKEQQIYDWGWRIPFLIGGTLGVVGIYMRKMLSETPAFLEISELKRQQKLPLKNLIKHHKKDTLSGFFFVIAVAVSITTIFMYLPTFLVKNFHYTLSHVFNLNCMGLALTSAFTVIWGIFLDRKKHNSLNLFAINCLLIIILIIPVFYILKLHIIPLVLIGYFILSIGLGGITAIFCYILVEMYPAEIRFTGVSAAYNIGFAIFGGITPIINELLCKNLNSTIAPAYFMAVICIFAAISSVHLSVSKKMKSKHKLACRGKLY